MKAVLLSIRPKWCEKIANGKKTIEVRKTKPSIPTPFKVLIYCTKDKREAFNNHNGNLFLSPKGWQTHSECNGKVIGEFVCNKIEKLEEHIEEGGLYYTLKSDFNEATQLDNWELHEYGKGKPLYGWHISDLKIYDKPKELNEFYTIDESGNDCCIACVYHETPIEEMPCRTCTGERRYLYRPPQSWCYVQE